MSVFIGRQPILTSKQATYGYELLFRSNLANAFSGIDGDRATLSVIGSSIIHFDLDKLVGNSRAFINCTRDVLVNDYMMLMPKEQVVVEILENIAPAPEIIDACYRLKNAGYTIALDDLTDAKRMDAFSGIADIVKVDFSLCDFTRRKQLAGFFAPMDVQLLAEKVETKEDFETARDMGYKLFQGYFFSKPTVLTTEHAASTRVGQLQLLEEVTRTDFDFERAEDIVKHDPGLAMRILKCVNSSAFGLSNRVESIHQALTLLGTQNIRKLLMVMLMTGFAKEKPRELIHQVVLNARYCELLAKPFGLKDHGPELFMLGLFSHGEAVTDMPLDIIVESLPLSDNIVKALKGEPSPLRLVLEYVMAYNTGYWDVIRGILAENGVAEEDLPDLYEEAVAWSRELASKV